MGTTRHIPPPPPTPRGTKGNHCSAGGQALALLNGPLRTDGGLKGPHQQGPWGGWGSGGRGGGEEMPDLKTDYIVLGGVLCHLQTPSPLKVL